MTQIQGGKENCKYTESAKAPLLRDGDPNHQVVFFLACDRSCWFSFYVIMGTFIKTKQKKTVMTICFTLSGIKKETQHKKQRISTNSTKTNPVTKIKTDQARISRHPVTDETPMPILSRKSFSQLPMWDFEDVYNQDAPFRPTACAESLRNSEDESFRKAFLPNIRLFLHKDNINLTEWNRLSHFNNPFGFMELNVMASVKLIPKPKEPLLLPKPGGDGCVRCAVVGTAGILNGSRMGKEIDAHDYVFRMNGAVLKGHEEDVGNRTSVPRTYYAGQYNESRFYVLHQDFLRYVRNRFLKSAILNSTHWAIVRPTNGAFTLFLALHTCDTVSAYGFMTEDYNKYYNYYFEKGVKTTVVFYISHDYLLEKNMWKKLHNSKIIRLYQRTD
ncbi:Alpha-N-acetylgalactosaminide alpha-2,6-sialyltransferase 1 [Collichthys lucidus]|uniref:alpha-N-acetylgalactosaminide alpha-2,6-sialyltransferase n=1 Tax=Collichthys lucidus TaxID=240159 RepID=A0A4U5VMU8_COLLU|nr:Alpha-N-acetylgalactosaminide alpha-2,6-sialyltransferase 1 [Collichthys lucidus]